MGNAKASGRTSGFAGIIVERELLDALSGALKLDEQTKVSYSVTMSDGITVEYDSVERILDEPNERGRSVESIKIEALHEDRNRERVSLGEPISGPVDVQIMGEPDVLRERLARFRGIITQHLPYYHLLARYRDTILSATFFLPLTGLLIWAAAREAPKPIEFPSALENLLTIGLFLLAVFAWFFLTASLVHYAFPKIIFAFGAKRNHPKRLIALHALIGSAIILPFARSFFF